MVATRRKTSMDSAEGKEAPAPVAETTEVVSEEVAEEATEETTEEVEANPADEVTEEATEGVANAAAAAEKADNEENDAAEEEDLDLDDDDIHKKEKDKRDEQAQGDPNDFMGIYVGFRRDVRAPTSVALSSLFQTKAGFSIDRIDMKPACAFIYVKKEMKTDDGITNDMEVGSRAHKL